MAAGLVLFNTLRAEGPRLAWINDAFVACARVGGLLLVRDLFAKLLYGEVRQRANRGTILKNEGYAPLADDAADLRLLQASATADWSIAWETVDPPVTVLTGRKDRVFLDTTVVEGILARRPQARALFGRDRRAHAPRGNARAHDRGLPRPRRSGDTPATSSAGQGLWHRNAAFAYGAVFIGVTGHATTEFVQLLSGVAGPELAVWRFTLGALGLVVVCLAIPGSRDLWTPLKAAFVPIVTLSLLGFAVAYLAFCWSLDFASAPQAATTVTTLPIFLALINLWRNGQPIGWLKGVTGISALLGIALVITDGALTQLAGDMRNLVGITLALVCALFVGRFMIFAEPWFTRYEALRMTTLAIVFSAIGLWVGLGLLFGSWVDLTTMGATPPGQIAALLTIGFFNTIMIQRFWPAGLAAAPDITRAAYLFFLKPVIVALLALWILEQAVSPMEWFAISIICSAVAFEASWPRRGERFGIATQREA